MYYRLMDKNNLYLCKHINFEKIIDDDTEIDYDAESDGILTTIDVNDKKTVYNCNRYEYDSIAEDLLVQGYADISNLTVNTEKTNMINSR